MLTFRQYLNETVLVNCPHGIFAKVLPTTHSILILKDRFSKLESPECNMLEDLHCTLMYSKTAGKNINLPYVNKDGRYHASVRTLEYWDGHDNEGYVVAKLFSPDLVDLNKKFRDAGFEGTFKDYNPHVSLLHPVPDKQKYLPIIAEINKGLEKNPVVLEMYYGGYVLLDEE